MWRIDRCVRQLQWLQAVAVMLTVVLGVTSRSVGQERTLMPLDPDFPDGISPSHVYARIDLLDRSLDKVIETVGVRVMKEDFPKEIESDLRPMHVYQAVITCTWRLQELNEKVGVAPIPNISGEPRTYHPRDVFFIVDLMLDNVRRIGQELNVSDMPEDGNPFSAKTPTDVFDRAVKVFVKLNALSGYRDLTPSEVFAQMVRATQDVKSILRQADPACRYYIDAPPVDGEKIPADVFNLCLDIRRLINEKRTDLGLETIPVPAAPAREEIRPRDVFFQTQVIIAELNLLKSPLHTVSSTPLAIPVTGKTPTDVFRQGTMLKYLLEQVETK